MEVKCKALEVKSSTTVDESNPLEIELLAYKSQIDEKNIHEQILQTRILEYEADISKLQNQLDNMIVNRKELESKIVEVEHEKNQFQNRVQSLKSTLDEASENLKKHIAHNLSELEQLHNEKSLDQLQYKKQIEDFEEKLLVANTEKEIIKSKATSFENQLHALQSKSERIQQSCKDSLARQTGNFFESFIV